MARYRGVLKVDINLGSVDVNQCATGSRRMFADTHRCPPAMQVCPSPVYVRSAQRQLDLYHQTFVLRR